jgi:hypothetical protein
MSKLSMYHAKYEEKAELGKIDLNAGFWVVKWVFLGSSKMIKIFIKTP